MFRFYLTLKTDQNIYNSFMKVPVTGNYTMCLLTHLILRVSVNINCFLSPVSFNNRWPERLRWTGCPENDKTKLKKASVSDQSSLSFCYLVTLMLTWRRQICAWVATFWLNFYQIFNLWSVVSTLEVKDQDMKDTHSWMKHTSIGLFFF